MNQTVWITGLAGFLGSHLADALVGEGYNVFGNDSLICGNKDNVPKSTPCYEVDCTSFDDMKLLFDLNEPDILVHAAATASEGFSVFSPHFITKNIAEASVATISAAIASGVKRIIFMSSMARYGHGEPFGPPFKEDVHIPAPIDPYGIAKVYAEKQLIALCEQHGVKWSILVPHNIIGTRQEVTPYRNVISIFLNRLLLDLPVYIYGDGNQKRSFSPVADCIPSLVRAVQGRADKEVINIGPDGNEITINDALSLCEKITGKDANRVHLPSRPLTDNVREAYCSSNKSRTILGYRERQDIEDCIKEMYDNFVTKPFDYSFPIEISSDDIPKTWKEKL